MKRLHSVAVVVIAALVSSCGGLVRHNLVLTFDDSAERVTISAATSLPTSKEAHDRTRVEDLRKDILAGRDEWSLRFANANPESDRVTFERARGELVRAERIATIDSTDLQKFFFDVSVSTTMLRGDGWAELAIYPGTSTRATRAQRDDAEKKLNAYAERAVRYFGAVRVLYDYVDRHPVRGTDIFTALFRDPDDPRPQIVTQREHDLITDVRHAIDDLAANDDTDDLEREADLVFNPLPASIIVRVPTAPLLVEGFERGAKGDLVIEPPTLIEAVASLEGRWISPDPLAFALRPESRDLDQDAATFAAIPRHASPVVGVTEVSDAIVAKLRPAPRYRVRWITKQRMSDR